MATNYERLFERVWIGRLQLKNRIVMSPMQTRFFEGTAEDATFTQWHVEYFRERARGGVGLIITGHIKAEKEIDPYPLRSVFPVLDRDERIKEFAAVTETVHRYGAKIAAQLSPGTGRLADAFTSQKWPAAPSALPSLYFPKWSTRELTRGEIALLVEAYGKAAGRVRRAGFDALYIHGLAFLMDQFLSSCWNHRRDEYGGSLQNRLRFFRECLDSARGSVGREFPIIVGLALEHGFEGGRRIEETIALAREMEGMGIDAFHVRNGSYDAMEVLIPNALFPDGTVLRNAARFKEEIRTPIIVDGKFGDPESCQKAIEEGATDLIAMGRQLLADPEWPNKVRRGRVKEIRPCIRCMECFDRIAQGGKYSGCSVNARLGHEREWPLMPALVSKKVLVLGGGPAGMEAARAAATRGHRVILAEKTNRLGGRLNEASALDYKSPIGGFQRWLEGQLQRSGVVIRMGWEAHEGWIREIRPDVIVVATGARPVIPHIPGVDSRHVVQALDVLNEGACVGERVLVVGGGPVGCDAAYKLAREGKRVEVIEQLPEALQGVSVYNRSSILQGLSSLGVTLHVRTQLIEVQEGGALVDTGGELRVIEADTIVLATGFVSDDRLHERFEELAEEVYVIGDAVGPRKIFDAIHEGYLIGKEM